jgi:hypothetical protein
MCWFSCKKNGESSIKQREKKIECQRIELLELEKKKKKKNGKKYQKTLFKRNSEIFKIKNNTKTIKNYHYKKKTHTFITKTQNQPAPK